MSDEPGEVTQLLAEARQGNPAAESRLAEVLYDHLHRLARRAMAGERPDHTLQPTVLVHEALLRLVSHDSMEWANRKHFFAVAANLMRRILIDHAREVHAVKRGSGGKVCLDEAAGLTYARSDDLLALDEALTRLAAMDPRQGQIVELRFFAGLTEEEIAAALDVSPRTVKRDWQIARAWLHTQMRPTP
jgi:RNA polymerase sigma factor (TIGR02999 family)